VVCGPGASKKGKATGFPVAFLFCSECREIAGRQVLPCMSTLCTLSQPPAPRLLYPRKDAAYQLGISIRSLDYRIAHQEIAVRRIGKRVLIPRGELVKFSQMNHYDPVVTEDED